MIDATALGQDRVTLGQILETLVYQEPRRQVSWHARVIRFRHYRDKDGVEVDFVLERGAHEAAGIEVKASATVTTADSRGLRKLAAAAGKHFTAGCCTTARRPPGSATGSTRFRSADPSGPRQGCGAEVGMWREACDSLQATGAGMDPLTGPIHIRRTRMTEERAS